MLVASERPIQSGHRHIGVLGQGVVPERQTVGPNLAAGEGGPCEQGTDQSESNADRASPAGADVEPVGDGGGGREEEPKRREVGVAFCDQGAAHWNPLQKQRDVDCEEGQPEGDPAQSVHAEEGQRLNGDKDDRGGPVQRRKAARDPFRVRMKSGKAGGEESQPDVSHIGRAAERHALQRTPLREAGQLSRAGLGLQGDPS